MQKCQEYRINRVCAAGYKVIFYHFVRLIIEGGLQWRAAYIFFVYFIERHRWRSSFLEYVFSTNSFLAFYSLQQHVHIRHRRKYV